MSLDREFKTVDLIVASQAKTKGVDAFALSLIKAEKQSRRLLTYLVYQYAWCTIGEIATLKAALRDTKKVYLKGLLAGWNALYPRSVEDLVGEEYTRLRGRLDEATKYRNKIFHGQLTGKDLSRAQLLALVKDIRKWCELFGRAATEEVGYDGCSDSFRKARNAPALCASYKTNLADEAAYRAFIKKYLES